MYKRIKIMIICSIYLLVLLNCRISVKAISRSELQGKMIQTLYGNSGGRISCDFDGYTTTPGRHEGIDFSNKSGVTIYSLCSGVVLRANNPSTGLSTLSIYDPVNDKSVIYLHATGYKVAVGQNVSQGQAIAVEGAKGASAAHTHVEVRSGKNGYASKSVNDPVLNNENPYPYWEIIFGSVPPLFEKDSRYPTPITAYPAATSGKITVYNSSLTAYSQSTRYIAYNDLCTINAIYTNGYCQVTYPTSSGSHTEYAKTSDFITNSVTPYAYSPASNLTTYTRSNLSTAFGSVFTTDKCTVVGKSGDKLEIIYPLNAGGYKLGWISVPNIVPSDFPTPLYGYNDSPTVRTTVYESVNTMGTYYGQIFVDDKCTLNAVNVSAGWIQVTYPVGSKTKTGYVYLDQFIPSGSRLTTFYKTTVTKQTTTYRKSDMATAYGYVSVGDQITVVGKSGNKLQVIYPLDAGGYKLAWIYNTDVQKNLTGISVTSNPSKTSYIEGQNLETGGLVVTAKYDDGSSADVTGSCSLSGYSSTVGVKTVNVSYGGKQTAFTVTVKSKSPTAIKLTSAPTKTNYYIGDSINSTGIAVQVTYDNGTTENVTEYDVLGDYDMTLSAGEKEIPVAYLYNNVVKTTSFDITVTEPALSLSKLSLSMKKGEMESITATTDPASQAVTWESSDMDVATVSDGKITAVSGGTATITASFIYNGISYNAEVNVTVADDPVILQSVDIATKPAKTTYNIGEALDTTGLSLALTYSDESSQTVSDGYTTSGFSSQTAGTKKVNVLYDGFETAFYVTVLEDAQNAPVSDQTDTEAPQMIADTKTARAGETVNVRVFIKNNPGIIGFRLKVGYDAEALTLKNISAVDFADVSFGSVSKNPVTISWSDAIHGNNEADGAIAELTFCVNDSASKGEYPITVIYDEDDVFNEEWKNVRFETVDGAVNVETVQFSDEWSSDDESHWKESTDGSGVITEKAEHSGGNATCHTKAVCEVCGEEYGDINPEEHDGETEIRNAKAATEESDGYTGDTYCLACGKMIASGTVIAKIEHVHSLKKVDAVWATHTEDGNIEYYRCEKCGRLYIDREATEEVTLKNVTIGALGHDYGTEYAADDENHWKECSCGSIIEKAAHAGGEANCHEQAVCEVCGKAYGEKNTNRHDGEAEVRNAVAATIEAEGYTGDVYCSGCGEKIAEGTTIAKLGHVHRMVKTEAVEATDTEDGNIEYYTCEKCGKLYRDAEGIQEVTAQTVIVKAPGQDYVFDHSTDDPKTPAEDRKDTDRDSEEDGQGKNTRDKDSVEKEEDESTSDKATEDSAATDVKRESTEAAGHTDQNTDKTTANSNTETGNKTAVAAQESSKDTGRVVNTTENATNRSVAAPKRVTGLSVKSSNKKQLTVSYKRVSGADGYEITYSTNKKFTKSTTKTVSAKAVRKTLKKLRSKKKYYVKIRAYKLDAVGNKVYGKYSVVKSKKTK